MTKKIFPQSQLPIRKTVELLPTVFQTPANDKFMSAVVDPLVQPGVLQKLVGYIGRRYGKTYKGSDIYLDTDTTLRSRYQLEPGVVYKNADKIENFYDYLDLKNQLKFFGNTEEHDDYITSQEHYTWNPPVDWDKFINYREYYWEPSGPPSVAVYGQRASITSTYKVVLGVASSYVFYPDGYTNNPTLTLYRGQTYKFNVNAPTEGFFIRTNYDTGSLIFDPNLSYVAGSRVVFDNKLWKAKVDVSAADGSTIDLDSQDWEYIDDITSGTALDYNNGVTNNGVQNGTLTFTVPYDSPDILYYQSFFDPDRFGKFVIADIESNTKIDIEKEVIGKTEYTSSNGIQFTNGLVVEFLGQVTPAKYASDSWLIEGVGTSITLTKFSDLVVPVLTADVPEVLFDNEGFDSQPFDDASAYPSQKDYITINRNSKDTNPWSRYNRWFHRSVLEYAYSARGQDFPATESARAKRPIIEFKPNLQLFNHGATAKQVVDYVDDYTTDVFSVIEGSTGYNVDGEFLFQGARILVVADTDSLANNKIYEVNFITHNNRKQISLIETADSDSVVGDCVLIRRGNTNGGLMYHFNGSNWVKSQTKTTVNQAPLFDAFDESGVSFADPDTYPVSTFSGSKILSYKQGNTGVVDSQLGFKLSYLNIDNVGDIEFSWNWDTDVFHYTINQIKNTKKVSVGFYKINPNDNYENGWQLLSNQFVQPILDSLVIADATNKIELNTIDWDSANSLTVNFYLNGKKITNSYTRDRTQFTFESLTFEKNDVVTVKIITDVTPENGYYQVPVGLEKNPLNQNLESFTLGQAIDHVSTSLEFDSRFTGNIPGISNLRDLDEYQQHGTRFLKHSGLAPLTISLLCDKTSNIVKAIQYSKKTYTEFKNSFINKAIELEYNDNINDFVDDIISDLTRAKTIDSPFADSDMIGSGAFTAIRYIVEDTGIKTFSLSQKFDLKEMSRRAVYVYLNNAQLLNGSQYEFSSTFGFVTINVSLTEGDLVEIREYISTSANFIPPTPTSIGLYKKYTPMKFLDDTYVEPRWVIQGHDGSITAAYDDFRDDLLLELEYRIYNNIKQEYDKDVFDIDAIIGGYYGNAQYNTKQLENITNQEFLKWIQNTNINYAANDYFDSEDTFTYTYSNMSDPTGTQNIPGWWRGVYKWFYDTDRPHRCPWEMLGFTEKPTWWETQYGPAPYTSNNLLLWEDIQDGIIRQGSRAGRYDRYARSSILKHIPVNSDGQLISPLDSGLAGNFTLINNKGDFKLGDVAPVEYAWRSSSEWPFAIITALCLMKPFDFITGAFDRSKTTTNILGQVIDKTTKLPITLADVSVPEAGTDLSAGLVQYLVAYVKSRGIDLSTIESKLKGLDVNLSTRLSGFVDKTQQKYLLDSKNPKSSSSSIFIPPENYDIIFNVSSPISNVSYSGVILEKTDGGWIVTGYDDINPYFTYFEAVPSQSDPLMSIGGVSESYTDWAAGKIFSNGQISKYQNDFYRALQTHTAGSSFDKNLWKKLAKIPTVGGVEAFRRKNFNRLKLNKLTYGSKLTSVQQVVDLLLGYEAYLQSLGFVFDNYDPENKVSQDWTTSCREFMFWTKHNWAVGSLITLSPGAQKVNIIVPVGVADNLLEGFYDYQVLKGDGKPLTPNYINVNRDFQNITIETTNTTDGIYFLKVFYVLKEHVTVFNDKTVFNDVIYDKTTGYRQERIKTQGYRTVDWDGDYTSPGFLFDNVTIAAWEPFKDYRLGDIVAYRSYNWTSLYNQLGSETFNDTLWDKLDSTPEKQLIANFDYKINQFDDYYNVAAEGTGEDQRALARHAIGYQTRDYLQNLSEDSVTQFQLYQGFIREKGTANSITKVFNKLSRSGDSSIVLNEEWAFRVGRLGGLDQLKEIELRLTKDNFKLNPQPILLLSTISSADVDQNYRLTRSSFTVEPIPFTFEVNPVSLNVDPVRVAGYVKEDHIDFSVKTRDDILNLDIADFVENNHVWVTFDKHSWTVLRYNESSILVIAGLEKDGTEVTITLNRPHSINVDDIVGIKNVPNLTGFFKVTAVGSNYIIVAVSDTAQTPEIDSSTVVNLNLFTEARHSAYGSIDFQSAALLRDNSKLWIDNNGADHWEVVEKKKQFAVKKITDYGISTPVNTGYKVLYSSLLKQSIASMPASGYAMTWVESSSGLSLKQIIAPPAGFESNVIGSFGKAMALSPDSKWLVIGSPNASAVNSNFKGPFDPSANYLTGDIVLYAGQLFESVNDIYGDGSSINVYNQDWKSATIINASPDGTDDGHTSQGFISIYEYVDQQWTISESFVSPRPHDNENFGSSIAIGKSGTNYYMSVSAPGSLDGTGRVYLYKYNGTSWSHIENSNYKGIYDPLAAVREDSTLYPAGSIVWYAGSLWQARVDTYGDGSSITVDSADWLQIDPVSTQCSLPQNVSLEDDGSTIALGLLSNSQIAELIKQGDGFGTSLAMSNDGSILVVGVPDADGQYFANYRGDWRMDIEYVEGDVVRYQGYYHRLVQRLGEPDDSTTRSFNEEPVGLPWENVGDSSSESSGKVFVYQRSASDLYELKQTITSGSMSLYSDMESGLVVNSGDQLGWAVDIDYSGSTIVITSPKADINYQNQGSAYVLKTDNTTNLEYRLKQKLESFELYPNEYFGHSVSISANTERIVIGAKNSPFVLHTRLDVTRGTYFDQGKTTFSDVKGYAGAVYVFEQKADSYFLTEKLETELSPYESFGFSVACTDSVVVVGSPDYVAPTSHFTGLTFEGPKLGNIRLFRKDEAVDSWEVISVETPLVDVSMIKSIALYDDVNNVKIQDIDYVDHAKLKILNVAEQEIKFKTVYDPAVYSIGTDEQVVDVDTAWAERNVGTLWWNVNSAKWKYYEQGDLTYRVGNWNTLVEGASIDVYEWVETVLLPNEWAALADTNEGLAEGISGQPLYPNNDVYSIKEIYNPTTAELTGTLYYYWVKNTVVVPQHVIGRRISCAEVASMINNPAGTGIAFVALVSNDNFLAYNFNSVLSTDTALLNIQYHKKAERLNPIHNEYQLLTEGVADSLPTLQLENKWIDSLVGEDQAGNRVPATELPAKQKYGLSYRPRQSMFVNNKQALKIAIESINNILTKEPFADLINFSNLNLVDTAPSSLLNLYDQVVDTEVDLITVGTVRTKRAVLRANIVDGEIDTIDIVDPGFGYKVAPPVIIDGDGSGAKATVTLDNQGRISTVTVVYRGKKYSTATISVRHFSVLVNADSTLGNFWSIYGWDDQRKVFFRTQSQSYDTTRYWLYEDWWKEGYAETSRIVKEILNLSEEPTIKIKIGDLIRIKEYANGGWAVFENIATGNINFLENYVMVGRENGTIKLASSLYDTTQSGIGYDNTQSFDTVSYDTENAKELRNILRAVKENIFIGDYSVEWNKLFFAGIRYAFAEQQYVDWAFKTSFLNATHNVGSLEQKLNYKNDNLTSFQDYIDEVKPYRTTVREYVSRYDTVEPVGSAVSDFDLPPVYSSVDGKIVSINNNRSELSQYPWKWWTDNHGYSIVSIEVSDGGSEYREPPKVLIEGNGTGALAQAYISNGSVVAVKVLNGGSGFTAAPTIRLVGGNGTSQQVAKAVAIIGDTKARTFDLTVKFDRINKNGIYQEFDQTETFVATGLTSVFDLNYAPTRDKSKISILKNSQVVLNNEYSIHLYKSSTDTYGLLKGKIRFESVPTAGDVIEIVYEKNDELLDAVNRIQKFYNPAAGMKGNELGQLMTGIDFGGVQIQGTTFDVTGGWDALPWFTDSWDSVESSADHYVVCDGSTTEITLPFIPADGQQITVYIKRSGSASSVRIDDPNYTPSWDSSVATNPNAEMPTFVGDGSTTVVQIGSYIQTASGDILIFRPIESDGSVTINDPNLVDTKLSGGTLSAMSGAYATATGTTAEEIVVDGDKFISPDQVPAPEENVPGQVIDSVSIKVYNSSISGAAPLQTSVKTANGSTKVYNIGLKILETTSLMVYVDNVKRQIGSGLLDYSVDFIQDTIEFVTAPASGSIIEIVCIGIGGLELLDYQEFVADGDTSLFLTAANYADTSSVFVTVNGEQVDVGFINSTDVVDTTDKTLIQFGFKPSFRDVVKIVCLGAAADVDSSGIPIVRVNQETFVYDGSTRSFDLAGFVNLTRASSVAAVVVEADGRVLNGIDTTYFVYDGITNSFTLGQDPEQPAGAILTSNIKVFVNDELKVFIQDYVYDGTTKVLTVETSILSSGDVIKIENDFDSEYIIENNNLVINSSTSLSIDDVINVTWFGEYPSMKLVADEFTGGKVQYQLAHSPLNASYVWIYKNGVRLTQDKDYYISLPRGVVYLTDRSEITDQIKIVLFGEKIYRLPSAFEIHKDMLNVYHFKRYSKDSVSLDKDLNYYDQQIYLTDATNLFEPVSSRNIPGIVWIQGEKIEYMNKTGNVLSQLRRGSFGTPIGLVYSAGTSVVDMGPQESLPYSETQDREDFYSDGSSLLIGPLPFVPLKSTEDWYTSTIPEGYGRCDQVEVFAGGRRLRKSSVDVYTESLGASSPNADTEIEAEFSVDGTSAYIRLTSALPAGTRVSVIRRTGKIWYERGATTASNGVTLLENETPIANFIAQKTTKLPE